MKTESVETPPAVATDSSSESSTGKTFWNGITLLLLASLFVLLCFRAATQPIAHDEGLAFQMFLGAGVEHVLEFNTVNHVIFTLLAKAFLVFFGIRELSFRAPTLLGAAIYFTALYFLCKRLFSSGLLRFLAVALLSLNPAILDFMTAARGYGLGVAFLTTATLAMMVALDHEARGLGREEWRWASVIASVCLALSVTANVTNIVPAAGLALLFVAIAGSAEVQSHRQFPAAYFFKYLVLPGAALGLFVMWPFLIQIRRRTFGIGLPYAGWMLRDIFNTSFLYKWTGDIYSPALGAQPPAPGSWQQKASDTGIYVFFPLLMAVVTAGLLWFSRASARVPRNRKFQGQLLCGTAIASVLMIFGSHILVHVNYQYSRTTLFLIPLFTLGVLLVANEFASRLNTQVLRIAGVLLIGTVLCDFALCLNIRYFRYNAYDAISRQIFQSIATDAESHGLQMVRVGGTWWYETETNFYRRRYKAAWMSIYDVKSPGYGYEAANSLTPADYDYFLCTPDDSLCAPENIASFGGEPRRPIFSDPATGVIVYAVDRSR